MDEEFTKYYDTPDKILNYILAKPVNKHSSWSGQFFDIY
jgi:hypothetical protein